MYRSQTFDWKRFCRYFSFDFQNAFRRHWLITLLAGLVPMFHFTVIGLLAILSGSEQWNTHLSVNDMILAAVSVSYFLMTPILLYGKITDRAEGAVWQMLPASHCEKYVSTILNSIVLFPLAFTVSISWYGLADNSAVPCPYGVLHNKQDRYGFNKMRIYRKSKHPGGSGDVKILSTVYGILCRTLRSRAFQKEQRFKDIPHCHPLVCRAYRHHCGHCGKSGNGISCRIP